MVNRLIWGIYLDETSSSDIFTLINYHRLSIKSANKLEYDCYLYAPKYLHKYFTDLNVKLLDIPNVGNVFFDYVKNYILTVESGEYYLLDGDLILNKRIPSLDADVLYEKKEPQSWKLFYESQVNNLTRLGIKELVPEWSGAKRFNILNIGFLYIKDPSFRKLWTERWKTVKEFVEEKVDQDHTEYTPIAAQYLLTELVDYYNLSRIDLHSNSAHNTYVHYMGKIKYNSTFIPQDRLLTFNTSLI